MLNDSATIVKAPPLLQLLSWADQYSHFSLLQNNSIPYPKGTFPFTLAVGAKRTFQPESGNNFAALKAFHSEAENSIFGFLGYDLKNELEDLLSQHSNHTRFDDIAFFEPEHLLIVNEDELEIRSDQPDQILTELESASGSFRANRFGKLQSTTSKQEYLETVQRLRKHIEEGAIYEINFCMEFWGEFEDVDPVQTYLELNKLSPKPFSAFQKFDDQYLLCASPERFLKKEGDRITSQPIKGTIRRGQDGSEDEQLKHQLRHDEKELAENMMIVDLVRNDLARSAVPGSVKVEELFGIYSFEQVHQMISTVTAKKRRNLDFIDVLKNAFPMGSMTGAPKIKVMELIERCENAKRGIFSGAAGYITPEGDFDFNVIIRSLFLNLADKQYSFQVGSAITYDSVPEKEYQECLLKAKAIMQVLGNS